MNRRMNQSVIWKRIAPLLLAFSAIIIITMPAAAKSRWRRWRPHFEVTVVSSAPDQVTGGDARLHIEVPRSVSMRRVKVLVNGRDQSDHFVPIGDSRTLSGVIDDLRLGRNWVIVLARGHGWRWYRPRPTLMRLTNYPIEGPVFSGPHQYPFVCTVQNHGLGQPLVDNESEGFPVFDEGGEVIGYSRDCSAERLVTFVYKSTSGAWMPYDPSADRPADMAQTTTMDGLTVDYIVRWERGTINRFIYSIAMLSPEFDEHEGDGDHHVGDSEREEEEDEDSDVLASSAWNGKLIYHFQGGVAIGHDQGDPSGSRMLYDTGLSQGYGVIYSTGTKSGTHYNLVLGGETALMVKERFVELYDAPVYTVGVGGSGGAIQQYIYGQNHKGLIDAAIPQYSYPDMITQAVHVGDCELMEFYMDVIDAANPRWQTWSNRTLLEGMNASDTLINPYTQALGLTECVNGWRGLSPLVLNPLYGYVGGQELIQPQSAVAEIEWTHFGDLVNIYGIDDDGYARNLWDNVGVQYGLESVASGAITPAEFLQLNATIGGWKNEPDMVQEGSPFFPPGVIDLTNWDPWSSRNQVFSPLGVASPAPRTEGDLQAMNAAYEAGLVFMGDLEIPVIDWRHYLEEELNMHNAHQSFAARQRMIDYDGTADNQVIWFTDARPNGPEFDQTPEALAVIDEWMANIMANPEAGVAGNKPALAVDRCFDSQGNEIASGDDVWDGILDDGPMGACTQIFPVYSTTRIVAGGPFKGSIFKCALKPVPQAVADGDYGIWSPSAAEIAQLETIFPDGVCDFSQPDVGLPAGW